MKEEPDYNQPVAFDKDGRPLYAHPPVVSSTKKAVVNKKANSKDIAARHDESMKKYPDLHLSEEQYVVAEVKRHIVGVVSPIMTAALLGFLLVVILVNYSFFVPSGNPSLGSLIFPTMLLLALIAMGAYIVIWVYLKNKLFLTNESVVQHVQLNLFARSEQVVDLSDITDIRFRQVGIFQSLFDYGLIELSTESEDKVYVFTNVANPKRVIAMLNNAIEDVKNGRPVGGKYIDR